MIGSLVRNRSQSSSSAEENQEGAEESAAAAMVLADGTCPQLVSSVGGLGALLGFI